MNPLPDSCSEHAELLSPGDAHGIIGRPVRISASGLRPARGWINVRAEMWWRDEAWTLAATGLPGNLRGSTKRLFRNRAGSIEDHLVCPCSGARGLLLPRKCAGAKWSSGPSTLSIYISPRVRCRPNWKQFPIWKKHLVQLDVFQVDMFPGQKPFAGSSLFHPGSLAREHLDQIYCHTLAVAAFSERIEAVLEFVCTAREAVRRSQESRF